MDPVSITLPFSKKTVTLRPYPTARYDAATTAVFLRESKVDLSAAKDAKSKGKDAEADDIIDIDEIPATALAEINNLAIQHFVLTIDGQEFKDKDVLLETCLDMHKQDFDAILKEANRINKENTLSDEKKAE